MVPMTPAQAVQAFVRLHEMTEAKLQAGSADRQRIAKALQEGRDPVGPRVDWLHSTSMRLIDVVEAAAKEFNAAHAGDRISRQDLLDALATAAALLRG